MAVERVVISVSLSPANPDAAQVLKALAEEDIPNRQRSATLVSWLAAYLSGQARTRMLAGDGMSDEELDDCLDDF